MPAEQFGINKEGHWQSIQMNTKNKDLQWLSRAGNFAFCQCLWHSPPHIAQITSTTRGLVSKHLTNIMCYMIRNDNICKIIKHNIEEMHNMLLQYIARQSTHNFTQGAGQTLAKHTCEKDKGGVYKADTWQDRESERDESQSR